MKRKKKNSKKKKKNKAPNKIFNQLAKEIRAVTGDNFSKEVLQEEGRLVLVIFWQFFNKAEILELFILGLGSIARIFQENLKIFVFKVKDNEDDDVVFNFCNLLFCPALVFFRDGEQLETFYGADQFSEVINFIFNSTTPLNLEGRDV